MASVYGGVRRRPAKRVSKIQPEGTPPGPLLTSQKATAEARKVAEIFALAGIAIGGERPWDLQVHDERFYPRLLSEGSLAAGETYMDGWWDCDALDELCTRVHGANLPAKVGEWKIIWLALKSRLLNRQRKSRSAEVAQLHYDLGNDIYSAMLDPRMQYTCGYWKDAATLNQAQENKLRLICRKIRLEPGMTVARVRRRLWRTGPFHGVRIRLPCRQLQHFLQPRSPTDVNGARACRSASSRRTIGKPRVSQGPSTVWSPWASANTSVTEITARSWNWRTGS